MAAAGMNLRPPIRTDGIEPSDILSFRYEREQPNASHTSRTLYACRSNNFDSATEAPFVLTFTQSVSLEER
jgi:hypothetical protein